MDLNKELEEINTFFDSISEEKFSEMMLECGANRILPTKSIAIRQESNMFSSYLPSLAKRNTNAFLAYTNYNDGIKRYEAA